MGDFNQPVTTDAFADVLSEIRANIASVAKMFNGTTDTNVPLNAVKLNTTNSRLELWDGSAWQPTTIGNLAANAVTTASILANAVDDTKFRGLNAGYLRFRNAANSADIGALTVDGSDNTTLNAASGKLIALAIAGASKWLMTSAALYPSGDGTIDFGSSSFHVANGYIRSLIDLQNLLASGNDLVIRTQTAHSLSLGSNGSPRWILNSSGHLVPNNASTFNIGAPGVGVLTAYVNTLSAPNSAPLLLNAPSGQVLKMQLAGSDKVQLVDLGSGVFSFMPTSAAGADLGSASNQFNAAYANALRASTIASLSGGFVSSAKITEVDFDSATKLFSDGSGSLCHSTVNFAGGSPGTLFGWFGLKVNGTAFKVPLYV